MEFTELIAIRYSVRSYRPDPVEEAKLQKVLEAARLAPTAANRQPFQIIVIQTANRKEELRRIYHREWFVQAPLILCVCGLSSQAWVRQDTRSYLSVDAAIVMDHMILAAADAGLGSCWIANFNANAAREILGLPESAEPLLFSPLGYAADRPGIKERKPLAELVRYERW
jgi:nitroreductase